MSLCNLPVWEWGVAERPEDTLQHLIEDVIAVNCFKFVKKRIFTINALDGNDAIISRHIACMFNFYYALQDDVRDWLSNKLKGVNTVEASAELSNASALADIFDLIGDSVEAFLAGFETFFEKFNICYTRIVIECIDKQVANIYLLLFIAINYKLFSCSWLTCARRAWGS